MTDAVYLRLYEEDLNFIRKYSKEEKMQQSKVLKNLIHEAVKQKRLTLAIQQYEQGFKTIREAATYGKVDYHEFFHELAKRNLLGATAEEQKEMLKDVECL
jgi:predicted HTH domain antitoxin